MDNLKMIFIFIWFLLFPVSLYSEKRKLTKELGVEEARKIFMLSGYISSDYLNAVEDGKVVSEFEFREMIDFCAEILRISRGVEELEKSSEILCKLIEEKSEYDKVRAVADEITKYVVRKGAVVPTHVPEYEKGKQIFMNLCSSCHGQSGEGPSQEFMRSWTFPVSPPPLTLSHISPAKVFAITGLGIEGTPMPAFPMSEKKRWDLSFYVGALRYLEKRDMKRKDNRPYFAEEKNLSVDEFFASALSSSSELEEKFGFDGARDIRLSVFGADHISLFRSGVEKAKSLVMEGKNSEAEMVLTSSYLIFEEVEPQLKIGYKSDVLFIEVLYAETLKNLRDGRGEDALENIRNILARINSIEKGRFDFDKTIASFVIVFREGFEAVLIISAISGIVSLAGGSMAPIFVGTIAGLISGVLLWELSGSIININREIMEGVFTLAAVFLIVWVSLWILDKSREESMRRFIEKTKEIARRRRWLGVFFLSFVSVGREAGETVLFLRALGEGIEKGVLLGALSLAVVIFLIYFARIKLKPKVFFISTNIILNITAVSLLGKAIVEFQEVGVIPSTFIGIPSFDIIGIFPTLESIVPQIFLALFLFGSMVWKVFLSGGSKGKEEEKYTHA